MIFNLGENMRKNDQQMVMNEEALQKRRKEVVSLAAGSDVAPRTINYLPHENKTWEIVSTTLRPIWDKKVANEVLEAREVVKLPIANVPQLFEVSERLLPVSGFSYRAVGGLVDINTFFGSLGDRTFLSTQYLRHPKTPLYTPEPDIIHEVIGHGTLLANPQLARLHELAGEALVRVTTKQAKQFIADVWWFSGEFGVLYDTKGVKALGAGILSSVGELEEFTRSATIRPINILEMATTPYRIDEFQKTLFAADSIDHLMEVVGGFFTLASDEMIEEMLQRNKQHR